MGFLFENVLQQPAASNTSAQEETKSTLDPQPTPQSVIQSYYETKIEELNIRMILKRYLRQTLKEILNDDHDVDKIFLFEIREILQKVQKRYDESDFPEFLELLNELFLICVDKEMSITKNTGSNENGQNGEENGQNGQNLENERDAGSIFIRAIQRQAINRLLNFNNME